MDNASSRLHLALGMALDLQHGLTWPGSRIPAFAHVLEVACRVASFGGQEDTILAALLHDMGWRRDPEALLQEIQAHFGPGVAELLHAAWSGRLLPHGDWQTWLTGEAPVNPELHLLVTADALSVFRNILLDWQVLAHIWDVPPPEDPSDRIWLTTRTRLPRSVGFLRKRWTPEDPTSPGPCLRAELVERFRGWLTLPLSPLEPVASLPALTLAFQDAAWIRWVEDKELVSLIKIWGLPGAAQEMDALLSGLHGLPGFAKTGFLRRSMAARGPLPPELAKACLDRMSMLELILILNNRHSRLVRALRQEVPKPVLDLFARDKEADPEQACLAEPILLHWIGEVASEGRLLNLSPSTAAPEPTVSTIVPGSRYRAALDLLLTASPEECWPATSIPYHFHPLEVSSLCLSAGWDEETAILALLHDLPRTGSSIARVEAALGFDMAQALQSYWRVTGLTHRPMLECPAMEPPDTASPAFQAIRVMDATSLLRFVADDFMAMVQVRPERQDLSRVGLAQQFTFFQGILYDKPLDKVAEMVLISSRFGPALEDWRRDLPTEEPDPVWIHPHPNLVTGEFAALLGRIDPALTEVLNLARAFDGLTDLELGEMVGEAGIQVVALAFNDCRWAPAWQALGPRLGAYVHRMLDAGIRTLAPSTHTTLKAQRLIREIVARLRKRQTRGPDPSDPA